MNRMLKKSRGAKHLHTGVLGVALQLQMNQMQKKIDLLNREVKDLKKALSNQTNNEHSTLTSYTYKVSDQDTSTLDSSAIIDVTKLNDLSNTAGVDKIDSDGESHSLSSFQYVLETNVTDTSNIESANDTPDEVQESTILFHNTGGVYLHAILAICYFELGSVKSWLAAVGAFSLTVSQVLILSMIWLDSVMTVDKKSEEVLCGSINVVSIIVLIFMSIVFACIIYDDIRESMVEEKILNYFVSNRKKQISSMRAIELLRICLRLRQFILPWHLSVCAIYLMLYGAKISPNEIILNFLSVGFVAEADNLMGRFLFSEEFNQKADEVVAEIIDDFGNDSNTRDDNDKQRHHKNVYKTFFLWPQTFAIFPATIITIASTFIAQTSDCSSKLRYFLGEIAYLILPNMMILANGIMSFVHQRQSSINLFNGYIHFMGEWILNCTAWLLLAIVSLGTLLAAGMIKKKFLILTPYFGAFFIACLCSRDFYHNHVNHQAKTYKYMIFATFSCFLFLSYFALMFFGLRD